MKDVRFAVSILFVLAMPAALLAQGGCVNSPENPTALLGLAGAAAAVLAYLRPGRGR